MGLNHQLTKQINRASDNMQERIKQQSNEWIVKLSLVSLSIIPVAGSGAGGHVGYLYYQLYRRHDAEALIVLYG